MAVYQNRAPRLDLSFPLEFRAEGATIRGHCLNLSESGLLGSFDEALELWTRGEILVEAGQTSCTVAARVARVNEREAGLAFAFETDTQRAVIRSLLVVAAEKTHLGSRPPF